MRKIARKIALKALETFYNKDINIQHHWTNSQIKVHSFKHKGYWYHGNKREKKTILGMKAILNPDMVCFEVGGHIGYMTHIFSECVGPAGKVLVFEPGDNNLPYLRENVKRLENVTIVEEAVSNTVGDVKFYTEDFTGQNNSLLKDYEHFHRNMEFNSVDTQYTTTIVPCTTLDHFVKERDLVPEFIKIDIEGAEFLAIQGAEETLKNLRPMLMVEITQNASEVIEFFDRFDYKLYRPTGEPFTSKHAGNTFCFPKETSNELQQLLSNATSA